MLKLHTLDLTDNIPFQEYLLADPRIKRVLRDFEFYNIRFYRQEKTKIPTVSFDYPCGNLFWFLDFTKAIKEDVLTRDIRYETEWYKFFARLKKAIHSEYANFKSILDSITQADVVAKMTEYHLRDYQAFDLLQLIAKMNNTPECPAGLILSEQRTGKSRVALSAARHYLEKGASAIVVAPKSTCVGWKDEVDALNSYGVKFFAPKMIKSTKELNTLESDPDAINVVIITYGLFKKFTFAQLRKLFNNKFSNKIMLIGDEVHKLRNYSTLQSKALDMFKEGCLHDKMQLHIIGLTGTPTVKESTDIFGLLSLINTSKIEFKPEYVPLLHFKEYFYVCEDTSFGKKCRSPKRTDELKYLIQSCSVQTKRKDLELFKQYTKKYLRYDLDMEDLQRNIYNSVQDTFQFEDSIDCSNVLVRLSKLQQICVDPSGLVPRFEGPAPKIKFTTQFIKTCNPSAKGIVMCKHVQPLQSLKAELDKLGIVYRYMDGSTTDRRQPIVDFRYDPTVKVFILQSDVGKEGLTLPEATFTIFLDRDYAQGFNEQAEDRMTPIDGNPVTKYVIDLVMRDSVEENIYDLLVTRKQSINTINTLEILRKEETTNG